jgi:SAM-dependent methyltransferase
VTFGFVDRRSIQLSYGRVAAILERELAPQAETLGVGMVERNTAEGGSGTLERVARRRGFGLCVPGLPCRFGVWTPKLAAHRSTWPRSLWVAGACRCPPSALRAWSQPGDGSPEADQAAVLADRGARRRAAHRAGRADEAGSPGGPEGMRRRCPAALAEQRLSLATRRKGTRTERGHVYRVDEDRYFIQHDVEEPFPIADASLDWCYSEHLIEHLTSEQGISWLADMRRLLKPGGFVRISTPDLRKYASRSSGTQRSRQDSGPRRFDGGRFGTAQRPRSPAWTSLHVRMRATTWKSKGTELALGSKRAGRAALNFTPDVQRGSG